MYNVRFIYFFLFFYVDPIYLIFNILYILPPKNNINIIIHSHVVENRVGLGGTLDRSFFLTVGVSKKRAIDIFINV